MEKEFSVGGWVFLLDVTKGGRRKFQDFDIPRFASTLASDIQQKKPYVGKT